MTLSSRKQVSSLRDPLPLSGESVVRIRERFIFPANESRRASRFIFPNRWAKLAFFLRSEGLRLTLRKVLSSRLQVALMAMRRVVFVVGQDLNQREVVAVGPMDCPESDTLVAPPNFWCALPAHQSPASCLEIVRRHFRNHPQDLEEVFDYSPFSGRSMVFSLEWVVTSAGSTPYGSETGAEFSSLRSAGARARVMPTKKESLSPELFMAGAGAYVHSYILPNLHALTRHTVVDLNPALAAATAERFGFEHADTSCERAFERLADCRLPVLVIATYHSTHVDLAELAHSINPSTYIFIEKPPVTSFEQLQRLVTLREGGACIEIGYNRRHARLSRELRTWLAKESGPVHMSCIVKELKIPTWHWYHWPTQGTRIVGNLCHWFDLATFFIGSRPVAVRAESSPGHASGDEVTSVVYYEDGSKFTLIATEKGNSLGGVQEYIEVRRGELTGVLDDYMLLKVSHGGTRRKQKAFFRSKGHREMYADFMQRINDGRKPYYPHEELVHSSAAYLAAVESCNLNRLVKLALAPKGALEVVPEQCLAGAAEHGLEAPNMPPVK